MTKNTKKPGIDLPETTHRVLITGASGYLGSLLTNKLAAYKADNKGANLEIYALDVKDVHSNDKIRGVTYVFCDIRSPEISVLLKQYKIRTVVHLAAIVNPGKQSEREFEYSVDVKGTENILKTCIETGVSRIIVTSSGAAYGYHSDNPELLTEEDEIRGNEIFAYSYHKRLVEEMLAEYRNLHPQLEQVIFRVGTILGAKTRNQITALFEKPFMIAVRGAKRPFVFIWDQDMVDCLFQAIFSERTGIYNVAGDGAVSTQEMAGMLNKKHLALPAWMLKTILWTMKKLHLAPYGPEQVGFLRYRPVLSNERLKKEFRFVPKLSSKETFEYFLNARSENAT